MLFGSKMTVEKAEQIASAMNKRDGYPINVVSVAEVMNLKPINIAKKGGQGYEVYAVQYGDMTVLCAVYADGRVRSQFPIW